MKQKKQTVIIVTAYGEDNYYQKQYEDVVGIYTSVRKAIQGALKNGMTNRQYAYLNRTYAFWCLHIALLENDPYQAFQVDYQEETDSRRKPITSSYMFRTFTLN